MLVRCCALCSSNGLSPALPHLYIVHILNSSCQSHSIFFPPSRRVHLLPRALALLLPELLVAFILFFPAVPKVHDTFLRQWQKEHLIILISRGWPLLVSSTWGSCHILFCLPGSSFSKGRFWSCRCPRWMWGSSSPPGARCSVVNSSFVTGGYGLLLLYILAAIAAFVDLLIILHRLLPSRAFQIWVFSQKQTLPSIWK